MFNNAFNLSRTKRAALSINSDFLYSFEKIASDLIEEPLRGKLRQTRKGFIYVEVPSEIMSPFRSMIKEKNVFAPPVKESVGAHITVVMDDEATENKIKIKTDKEVEFWIRGFYSVIPDGWKNVKKCWFLVVDSPDIEKLRTGWGLTKKDRGHRLHITVAVQYK